MIIKKLLLVTVLLFGTNTWCVNPFLTFRELKEKKEKGERLTLDQERRLRSNFGSSRLCRALRKYLDAQIKVMKSVKIKKGDPGYRSPCDPDGSFF